MATITGTGAADLLIGDIEDDILYGGFGADTLIGNAGNDTLSGRNGVDSMVGGAGDDLYLVAKGDTVHEEADEGTDTVKSEASFILPDHFERLVLIGTATTGTGNALDNLLVGNAGWNILKGGAGADTMRGGGSNDNYYVDDPGDLVVERAGEGTDHVTSWLTYTLPGNVEILQLAGVAAIDGTGNSAANNISGNSAANVLRGWAGNDQLGAGAGNDTLYGGTGNDTLDAGSGNDVMFGGLGNDEYWDVDTGDIVRETLDGGIDLVRASRSFTLPAHVENLTILSTAPVLAKAIGNGLANVITGSSSAQLIHGKGGADVLLGLGGNDKLVFDPADTLIDGGSGTDTLLLGGVDLDLIAIPDDRILGIERIQINGSGDNQVSLSAQDVLALSDTDTVVVVANAGDVVNLHGTWDDAGAGAEYHTYVSDAATVLVSLQATVMLV